MFGSVKNVYLALCKISNVFNFEKSVLSSSSSDCGIGWTEPMRSNDCRKERKYKGNLPPFSGTRATCFATLSTFKNRSLIASSGNTPRVIASSGMPFRTTFTSSSPSAKK